MKILTASPDYLPNVGGVAAHVHQLTQALARAGHEVAVVKSDWGRGPDEVKAVGPVEAHYIYCGTPRIPKLSVWLRARKAARYMRGLHRERRFDVLHWHHFYMGCLETRSCCKDIPRVFTNHSSMFLDAYYARELRKLRFYLGHADWIIAPSHELVEASHFLLGPERCSYIPNAVDPEQFSPALASAEVRRRFGIPENAPLVVTARRLVPKCGVIYLAQAAERILSEAPQTRILIVGDGPERPGVEAEIDKPACRGKVVLAGSLPNTEMPAILASSDVAALPSLLEATSIFGLEAMACECAIVGTRVGGIPEIVDEGRTGLLIPPREPAAMAEAVVSLVRDPGRLEAFKKAGRQRVLDHFTWDRVAEQTAEVYERARTRLASGS